jgi:dihydrofolate synthase/folylpolyglutamate synthase
VSALSYEAALAALSRALVFGINPSLDGIRALCETLGRPQDAFSVVQVAGTNGKGSTARMIHALLQAEGCSVGLYTSPELERMNERIELDAGPVSDARFAGAVSAVLDAADALRPGAQGTSAGFTEFELLTAAALWLFRDAGVEFAVLEVGMGGRWDATSVALPSVAVITGVGLDHTAILGDTLEKIAAEKAAIIGPGSVAVLGPGATPVEGIFLDAARKVGVRARAARREGQPTPVAEELTIRFSVIERPDGPAGHTTLSVCGIRGDYGRVRIGAPAYQAANAATAIAAAEAALGRGLAAPAVSRALGAVTLPGRFELVRSDPAVIVDGSHNPQAAAALAGAIVDAWPDARRRPLIILGVLADKDAAGIVEQLVPVAGGFVVTAPDSPRARAAADLAATVESVSGVRPRVADTLSEALATAFSDASYGIVVGGSLSTAGQARRLLRDASVTRRANGASPEGSFC